MKKISPEEYWKWDKFEGETSAEDMKDDFKRYVKEQYGKNIEFVKSDNPDTFKALFSTVDREDAVIQVLEDVKTEIEAMYGVTDYCDGSVRIDKYEVLESIDRKIAEVTKNE